MFEIKPISTAAIPSAIAKAERYRLLNEPHHCESICRDILAVSPGDQAATVMMLLALTDQFGKRSAFSEAQALARGISDEYQRCYYQGLIRERWATAQLEEGMPGYVGYEWLREAMVWYERAEACRPFGNDDALLRWNACVRLLQRDPRLQARPEEAQNDTGHGDDAPATTSRGRPGRGR